MAVNIGGPANDSSYRYKMPKLIAVVEGRGNGIRTRISNLPDIARALKCRADYPLKFFGFELGAQSKWNEKEQACIVNGAHQAPDLQRLLGEFINKFVLCPRCALPETDLEVKKGCVYANCSACGFYGALVTKHKLASYIIKYPPAPKKKKTDGKAKDDAAATGKRKRRDGPEDTSSSQNAAAASNDDPFAVEIDVNGVALQDDDDVGWSVDTSEAATLKRQKEQIGGNRVLADLAVSAVSRDISETADEFLAWYSEEPRSASDVLARLRDLQSEFGHTSIEMLSLFCDVVWGEDALKRLPDYEPIFAAFCTDSKGQKVVLGYLERFLSEKFPQLLKFAGHFLKALYELDVIDEETTLAWADKSGSKYVKKDQARAVKEKAAVFINWLRDAAADSDDEGEGEDGDDDADEIGDDDEDTSAPSSSVPSPRVSVASLPKAAAVAAEDDDIDIDDI
eukprot:Amastigsp_a508472_1412.p2 type:complete len:453 gc:universal Amastigsp_a508472_1412:259-1617(+)